jgi:heme oxygenase
MMDTPLLTALRQQTANLHQDVEQLAFMRQLLSADLQVEQYLQALQRLYQFVAAVEPNLVHHFGDEQRRDYAYFPRLADIREDITELGGQVPTIAGAPAHHCPYRAIGQAYVIEGSTSGGKLLAQRLKKKLGLTHSNGLRYFGFHRRGTWSLFVAWVAGLELTATQQQACIEGAKACFQLLLSPVDRRGVAAWQNNLMMT